MAYLYMGDFEMATQTVREMKKALLGGYDEQGEPERGLFDYVFAPGEYVKGVMAGTPGERKTGREVLESWGLAGPNQEGLDWGDVGGTAIDIFNPLEPLNLLFGGGLLKAAPAIARGIRALPALLKAGGRTAAYNAAKGALMNIPGAAKRQALGLSAGLGIPMAGAQIMNPDEEGPDWRDILGMGMMTLPLALPLGMAAARKARTKAPEWMRKYANEKKLIGDEREGALLEQAQELASEYKRSTGSKANTERLIDDARQVLSSMTPAVKETEGMYSVIGVKPSDLRAIPIPRGRKDVVGKFIEAYEQPIDRSDMNALFNKIHDLNSYTSQMLMENIDNATRQKLLSFQRRVDHLLEQVKPRPVAAAEARAAMMPEKPLDGIREVFDPSELPVAREGTSRVFHGTREELVDKIKQEGLLTGRDVGGTAENAPVVFGLTDPHFRFGGTTVVADVPTADVMRQTGSNEIRVSRGVRPEEIVAIMRRAEIKPGDTVIGTNPDTGSSFSVKIKKKVGDSLGGEYATEDGKFVFAEMHNLRKQP